MIDGRIEQFDIRGEECDYQESCRWNPYHSPHFPHSTRIMAEDGGIGGMTTGGEDLWFGEPSTVISIQNKTYHRKTQKVFPEQKKEGDCARRRVHF